MRIDVHAHVVEQSYLAALTDILGLERVDAGDKLLLRKDGHTVAWTQPDMFDIATRLRDMDKKQVDVQLLSLSTPNVYPWAGTQQIAVARAINDHTAGICRAHPDRFRGLASLPMSDIEAALAELARSCDELGMTGIAIGSNLAGVPLNHASLEPLWQEIDRRRLPLFMHPMFPVNTAGMDEFELPLRIGFPFDTTTAATRLIYGGVLERYPNLTFILAHTGGTLLTLLERLDNGYRLFPDCRKYITRPPSTFARRFYYDTASFFAPAIMMAHATVGADRLLFGTDNPFISGGAEHVLDLPLGHDDKTAILGGNAATLFNIK